MQMKERLERKRSKEKLEAIDEIKRHTQELKSITDKEAIPFNYTTI